MLNHLAVTLRLPGGGIIPLTTFEAPPVDASAPVPALPEEELLARMLFGDGVTNLSATDALQLGAAVASLRGGGGMDPINRLRTAIGLDRLRIIDLLPHPHRRRPQLLVAA